MASKCKAALMAAALLISTLPNVNAWGDSDHHPFRHVLLISIDGMHALDFINCSKGINGGEPYCPHLAELGRTGVSYRDTSTSRPSDSFPGLTAIVSGGTPRTEGAFYDVAYDRSLDPPTITTGNGVAGTGKEGCVPGAAPTGTTTEFEEGIDFDQSQLNGGVGDGGIQSIDPLKLERDPSNNCAPVYPWDFVRTNTIFGVVHTFGGYTAWSDKHPSYSSVSGHGSGGKAVDDYYSPEINSVPVSLKGISAQGVSCDPLPDQTAVATSNAWTDSFQNIQCYDQLKVNAVLNWINGKTHNGTTSAPRPVLFGMNFQTVSVGQKLIEKSVAVGGYKDSIGTPSPWLLKEIVFADNAIGAMVEALKANGMYDSTLIVITAKHGQSPVDSARYLGIANSPDDPVTTSPATILDDHGCLPASESPSTKGGIGPTEDDVSLIWLNSNCTTADAVGLLESSSPANHNLAGIGEIFSGPGLTTYFNRPGLPPNGDPRTPDIIVTPNVGVTYSGSSKKLAEHGGFSRDDTNVMLLLSNPRFSGKIVTSSVETTQVAPTILAALGLDPNRLQAVRIEGTQVLPGIDFADSH
ncbi:MAG: alkaline phosphatase family protein [Acidobacteria bacterium]|nr:alkaline phosphatase family protein [Acidobacteriota bacterium]